MRAEVYLNFVMASVSTKSGCFRVSKGWTLPTDKQIKSNTDATNFDPVLGGTYANGVFANESTRAYWWVSEEFSDGTRRRVLYYKDDNNLSASNYTRRYGLYIRCVSEEKTVSDLTYMRVVGFFINHSRII